MLILGPYSNKNSIKGFEIENLEGIKRDILAASFDESKCTLVFIKNKSAFAYGEINRFPIDFAWNNSDVYLINKSQCQTIHLKKINEENRFEVVIE